MNYSTFVDVLQLLSCNGGLQEGWRKKHMLLVLACSRNTSAVLRVPMDTRKVVRQQSVVLRLQPLWLLLKGKYTWTSPTKRGA